MVESRAHTLARPTALLQLYVSTSDNTNNTQKYADILYVCIIEKKKIKNKNTVCFLIPLAYSAAEESWSSAGAKSSGHCAAVV